MSAKNQKKASNKNTEKQAEVQVDAGARECLMWLYTNPQYLYWFMSLGFNEKQLSDPNTVQRLLEHFATKLVDVRAHPERYPKVPALDTNAHHHVHDENCQHEHVHDENCQHEHVHDENCHHEHVHDENCKHEHTAEQPKVEVVEQAKEETKVVEPKKEVKTEQPKQEEKKVEQPKQEEKKVEQPKQEEKKVEQPKQEEKKVEQPKEEEKVEQPKQVAETSQTPSTPTKTTTTTSPTPSTPTETTPTKLTTKSDDGEVPEWIQKLKTLRKSKFEGDTANATSSPQSPKTQQKQEEFILRPGMKPSELRKLQEQQKLQQK